MSSQIQSVEKGDGQLDFGFVCIPAPWAAANIRLREILRERRDLIRDLITRTKKLKAEICRLNDENEELRGELQ